MRRLALIAGLAATTACGSTPPAEVSPLALTIDRRPDPGDPTIGLQEAIPTTTVLASTTTTLDQQRVSAPKSSRNAAPRPTRGVASQSGGGAAPLACIRAHESDTSGGYAAVSPNGRWFGAYQFTLDTWRGAVTRAGHPEHADTRPDHAPSHVQDAAARQLFSERGLQPWPPARNCA